MRRKHFLPSGRRAISEHRITVEAETTVDWPRAQWRGASQSKALAISQSTAAQPAMPAARAGWAAERLGGQHLASACIAVALLAAMLLAGWTHARQVEARDIHRVARLVDDQKLHSMVLDAEALRQPDLVSWYGA